MEYIGNAQSPMVSCRGIQRFRDIRMLERIFHSRSTSSLWEGPEDIPFINTLRNKFVREVSASLRIIILLCRTDLKVRNEDTLKENLKAMEIIGS